MTPLSLVDSDPAELDVDAIIIGLHSADGDGDLPGPLLAPGAESVAAAFDGQLAATLTLLGATGSAGEVTKLATLGAITAPVIAAVGLGGVPADGCVVVPDTLRRAASTAVRALAGATTVAVALPVPDNDDATAALRALTEGALLGTYRFAKYKTVVNPVHRDPVKKVALHVADAGAKTAKAEVKRAGVVAGAVCRARDWTNTAPNELRPPDFAEQVAAAATDAGLSVEVLDEKALRKQGFGGLLAVGQGSSAPPRLVRLSYRPSGSAKTTKAAKAALVGKGITFDTGGYAVKPAQGMWEMKADMSGAAAVAATMIALASLKPKLAVTAYIPMAENMISGTAYRPGDVITMYGGKRVEVLNPDAEGRMILADAIARAGEDSPDYLIEASTLTGGQIVALGKRIIGVMGDPALCDRVRAVGEQVGEPAWPMPIPDDVRKTMDSEIADVLQMSAGMERAGSMLQGGAFLREFVPAGVAWAHLDIAGPAFYSGEPAGYLTKGGTGVPVRTLLGLLDDIAAHG